MSKKCRKRLTFNDLKNECLATPNASGKLVLRQVCGGTAGIENPHWTDNPS